MSKVLGFIFCIIIFCGTSYAEEQEFHLLPLTGRIFNDIFVPTDNAFPGKPLQQLSLSLWLESAPKISENTAFKFVYQGDGFDSRYSYVSGDSTETHLESRLREGYISSHRDGYDIKVGKQIISWGKTDAVNPTDFHSAKNYAFFTADDEVRQLGSTSAQLSITPESGSSPFNFTTIWTPIFAQSKLLIPPSAIPKNILLNDPASQQITFANSEISEKVSFNGQGWDSSVSFFNGWSHMPELQEVSHTLVGSTPVINVTQVFHRIQSFGADVSYSTSKWVFRGESSYSITPNDDGSNMLILPTHWDTVLGAERPIGDFFRIQFQILMRYFPHYTSLDQVSGADPVSAQVNQLLARANALLLQYQDPSRPGSTIRLSYTNEQKGLDAEIFWLQNYAGGDYLVRPKLGYAWTDTLRSSAGVELYGGPSNRPLGALRSFSAFFAETKYTF